jgi:hypothetical protein
MSPIVQQTYYIVLPPPREPFAGPLRPLARLLDEPEDAVKARLAQPVCQFLKRFAKKPNAEGLAGQLHALGLETFLLSDGDVQGHLFLWAESANQGAGGFAMVDFGGQPLYCPFTDVMAVTTGMCVKADGTLTQLIDIHRRSTPITPRIDASLFDFSKTLNRTDANARMFLEHLNIVTDLVFDSRFDGVYNLVEKQARALASRPSLYEPPADRLAVAYEPEALATFNVYSLLERGRRAMIEEKEHGRLGPMSGPPSATL